MDLTARLAVLVACAVAAGCLLVLGTESLRTGGGRAGAGSHPLPGLLPAALAGFIVVAAGGALTRAGIPELGALPSGLIEAVQGAGIGLLFACGLLAWRIVRRKPLAVAPTSVVVLAWAGAALALVSWLAAIGTALTVIAIGFRSEARD